MEIFGILGVFLSTGIIILFIGMTVIQEYPKNPLRWAQERRRRVSRATVQRISTLEHDLGYMPCSDDRCYRCANFVKFGPRAKGRGHPIWDNPKLPAPPPMMPIDDLAKKAYDKDIALRTRRGTVSGGPR